MEVFLTILTALLTLVLVLVSAFMVIVILMQRASSNAGLGSALGGGAAESAFGGATSNVLIKATVTAAIIFFVLAYLLHLLYLGTATGEVEAKDLPTGITGVIDPGSSVADLTADATAPADATADATSTPLPPVPSFDLTPDAVFDGVIETLENQATELGDSIGLPDEATPTADPEATPSVEPAADAPEVTPDS
ncbi:MAG: preprotein translocase subunit SecG [Opitutales bacterium]